ncbi:MAG: ABC transporter substrate-binding protein [Streptosporangiaceae bacterium]
MMRSIGRSASGPRGPRPWWGIRPRLTLGAAGIAAAALAVAGCGSSSGAPPGASSGPPIRGGTATVGVISGNFPNWIWPFTPISHYSVFNSQQFQWLMYRPLYMFGNNGTSVAVNYPLSPANPPVYSNGGRTVTITMRGWKWSDGESVSASDVAFWINMEKAEKSNYAGYSPGTFPDNLASFSITSPNTIVLHLTQAYSPTWFTYNQLAEITPMPAAWDVTSAGAAPGSGGCATSAARCKAVFKFLTAQAQSTGSYASSPIWSVVDGPWKLKSFSNSGNDMFVPNKAYSGSPKPRLAAVQFVPYTSDTTQYTALKSGSLDVTEPYIGIPPGDLPPKSATSSLPATNPLGSAYTLKPMYSFGINYYQLNFKNPTYGPVFRQLYFRQALEHLLDQVGIAKAVYRGYAVPGTGAVPAFPPSKWIPTQQKVNGGAGPYPFSVATATSLLTSHGWKMVGGVMTCEVPAKCGAGVKKGTRATLNLDYSTGLTTLGQQADVFKSDASKAGIVINPVGETFNTVISKDTQTNPSWEMSGYGGWAFNGPGFAPTGEPLFQTGAGSNSGSFSSPMMNRLIKAAETSSGLTAFDSYANYAALQLPYLFTPNHYSIQASKSTLHGVTFDPLGTFLPEYWYFTK